MFRYITVILIFGSIYSFSYIFTREPFEVYPSYIIFALYFPVLFVKYGVPKWPVLIFLPLFISGLLYIQTGDNTSQQFFKIFIGFFSSTLFYHYVIQVFDYDLKLLFRYYMKSAYIVSIIGIIQLVSFTVGFRPGYDFHWIFNKWSITFGGLGIRMNSVFSEPAYFAAIIAPAFFVCVYNVIGRNPLFITKQQSWIMGITYLLSFSSLGILAVFFTILFLLFNLGFVRYSIVFIPLLIFTSNWAYENVPEFRERWDGTFEIYTTDNIYSYDIHGSSFVLYNNSHVAWQNFIRHPILGTGLGSHPIAFDKYTLTNEEGAVQIDFNKMDANSMFLRLMSETGLYGMLLMIMLVFRCWVFKQTAVERELWVMSNALLLIILLYLLRQGHYFINGFPFFLWMYYYVAMENWRRKREAKAEAEALKELEIAELRRTSGRGQIAPGNT